MPGPWIFASVTVSPDFTDMQGLTFHPWPNSLAKLFERGKPFASPPFSPFGFSAEMDLLSAGNRKHAKQDEGWYNKTGYKQIMLPLLGDIPVFFL